MPAKKKAAKKEVVKSPSKELASSPMGLENVWRQPEISEAWDKLSDKYQIFLLFYIGAGERNGRKTYHGTVDKTASDGVARTMGHNMLANVNIGTILAAMRSARKMVAFETVERIYLDASEAFKPVFAKDENGNALLDKDGDPVMLEIEDHDIRIKAGKEYAKLEGLNQEKSDSTATQINVQIIQLPEKREIL